ncbi:uncharacterized protein K489DRAFT_414129 [Dissoconium aciculare CBS 342.82]|uniref:Uncharacterized protein n=1 Tax=Dissoconium aciculare CBS 342.82 TaxID=1314786 RepID=A0A6J3LRP3_9PEZI|nr:uncharacterized protein K489DRAFT_414129 [Dissoconium aciculare CBS 342.82]KAF1817949.1 hypothetical protein K489DRAFT_414129 [Dissoconium aciculare CBS 342.82]
MELLSSTLLWKTWWELPSSSSVLRSPAPVSHNAPPPASHAFLLEATTRVNALLTAAGRDISTQILSPALAAFPRRPEIILNALRALMEIVLPTPAPPANWNFRTDNHGRVLSESDKAKFGVLLEIVRFAGKGEIWTYGRGVGWR